MNNNYSKALNFFVENKIQLDKKQIYSLKNKFNNKIDNDYIKKCNDINKAVFDSLKKLNKSKELVEAFLKANNRYKSQVGENLEEYRNMPPYYGCPFIGIDPEDMKEYEDNFDKFTYYIGNNLSQDACIQFIPEVCSLLFDKLKQNSLTRKYCNYGIIKGIEVCGDGDEGEIGLIIDIKKLKNV